MKAYGTGGTAPSIAVHGCGAEEGHVVQPLLATKSEGLQIERCNDYFESRN